MSEEESAADWAQLVCLTDAETPPFLIAKDKFTIGRARGCDVSHENNKLVSGTHCYILRDDSGKVWLYDTSTNGTLLNSRIKLSKGECREIEHGDEFYVVHKKGEEHVNIGYVFQDLARLKEEEEDDSAELDQTLEYEDEAPAAAEATLLDDSINREEEEDEEETRASVKRKRNSASNPSSKRTKTDRQTDPTSPAAATTATATATAKPTSDTTKDKDTEQHPASKLTDKEPKKDEKGGDKKEGEEKEGEEKEGEGKEKAGGKKSDGGGKEAKQGKKEEEEEDAFADTLTCIICQELLYDCVSVQPCMHSFCAGCYSGWMAHSTECPSCRGKVDRINKNHIVNNLVEAYLKEHPEKQRPEEDRKDLDAKNKITRDMLYPSRKRASSSEYESSEGEEEEDVRPVVTPLGLGVGTIFGFGTPLFGAANNNAYRAQCRQCPGSKPSGDTGTGCGAISCSTTTTSAATSSASGSSNNNNNNNDTNNNTAQQPSTSGAGPSGDVDYQERDKKTMPEAPAYTCRVDQNHVLCQCCLQIFPDRRAAYNAQPDTNRPQQCTVCYKAFCHAYWGCRKADCNGCLAKFADMTFGRKVLPGLILNNGHESDIFSNYLDSKRLAVRDVLAECITKLEGGEFSCPDQVRYNITGQTPLCFACGLRNFKSLAYQYRAQIPRDQLPAAVTARPDCYWGKNCFTQTSKPAHAMRFNHVCEQTRR